MKRNFFLAVGLLGTAFGFAQQTNSILITTATNTDGNNNVIIGDGIGSTTSSSTYIGNRAGRAAVGNNNVLVGRQAGENINSNNNVYIGTFAGQGNTGGRNVFLGDQSGEDSTGEESIYIGTQTGENASGNNNIFIGESSGNSTIGDRNIFIGERAGVSIDGSNNILIGNNAGQNLSTSSNLLYIENSSISNPLIYGEFDNNVVKFNAEKVGIGYEGTGDPGFGDFPANTAVNYSDYRLFVRGGILAEEVRIRTYATWADYVFAEDYKLQPLSEVEAYIKNNGHLPNMPSAEKVQKEGLAVGEIIKLQQEKIEELTLHLIKQEKEMKLLKEQVQQLLNKE